jgi:hypothetical protein
MEGPAEPPETRWPEFGVRYRYVYELAGLPSLQAAAWPGLGP